MFAARTIEDWLHDAMNEQEFNVRMHSWYRVALASRVGLNNFDCFEICLQVTTGVKELTFPLIKMTCILLIKSCITT